MDKHGERDEKRRHRLSLLGIQSDRSDDSSDDGRTNTINNQNVSAVASLPPSSSQASTSQRAEKHSTRPSMFSTRSSFLVGGEMKTRVSNAARMPSRRSIISDVEAGGIFQEKQQPRQQRGSAVGSLQRNESQMSIPGAFRFHANGTIDDDPTVYSQNTKESNPFVIDHASLIENPDLRAHLASGGAIPTDHQYTNETTGGPTPDVGAYPMPSYALHRTTTPTAMPSLTSPSPIGAGNPVSTRRNQDGLRYTPRQIRFMFLMLAVVVAALITGVAVAIDGRSQETELPMSSMVENSPPNEQPLEWNDDGLTLGYSNDAKDVMDHYINEDVFSTKSPTAAPSVTITHKPTLRETRSPTQSPSSPYPTPLPTTPKPTEPLATVEPSSAPTDPRPSSSPSNPFPSQSPTSLSSSSPSVTATTSMPSTLVPSQSPSQFPSTVVTSVQPTATQTVASTEAPTLTVVEKERTVGLNATNTTESDNGDLGQNSTNTTGSDNGDIGQNTSIMTGSGEDDLSQNSPNTTGSDNRDAGQDNTNTTGEGDATMNEHNVTQDFWRGQDNVATASDAAHVNWSE
ncbi:MAG: hypothetical protein SGBAC_007433 [Bacillariaceae sp.]